MGSCRRISQTLTKPLRRGPGTAGGLAGGFFATSVGGLRPLGLEGWRFAFHVVAGISIGAGLVVLAIARDPRRKARACSRAARLAPAWLPQKRLL